jgi:hypothetical protein
MTDNADWRGPIDFENLPNLPRPQQPRTPQPFSLLWLLGSAAGMFAILMFVRLAVWENIDKILRHSKVSSSHSSSVDLLVTMVVTATMVGGLCVVAWHRWREIALGTVVCLALQYTVGSAVIGLVLFSDYVNGGGGM